MIREKVVENIRKMETFKSISPARLQELLDHIRKDVRGWKAVDVTVDGPGGADAVEIAGRLEDFFGDKNGAIFVCGGRKVLTLGKLGDDIDMETLKKDIARHLPGYSCSISTGTVTREGLETIAIRLKEVAEKSASPASHGGGNDFLKQRMQRAEKTFFVVDDDLFMRSLLVKALKPHGRVFEFADGAGLAAHYLKELPDVVFLDIHLPCGSGMDILDEIMGHDHTAGVVILSADRVKDNVLLAQARGAKSFIAKPFTREKVEEAMRKCLEQAALLSR